MKILVANWKANPATLAEAQELFRAEAAEAAKYKNVRVVICPPFVYLEELAEERRTAGGEQKVQLGAQDLSFEPPGPFTGETPAQILKGLGVSYALVGHSDRRYPPAGGGETDEMINKKIKAALDSGITPVLLVGEKERDADRKQAIIGQLSLDLANLPTSQVGNILIAYEPVWAISTTPGAKPDTPENTLGAIEVINEFLSKTYNLKPITCLYGGSVNENNVADFLKHPEISGAVIGGASLRKDEFANILKIVSQL